ncbi:hypothetical protein BKA62DRAFT_510333 [Auriculariales sp. MPI-PUGE-AT-0066]|nr:hypothetical protein BKA62DRAFT_510333 [Auriculariales sp. MPI-PUGE-AT-0066]
MGKRRNRTKAVEETVQKQSRNEQPRERTPELNSLFGSVSVKTEDHGKDESLRAEPQNIANATNSSIVMDAAVPATVPTTLAGQAPTSPPTYSWDISVLQSTEKFTSEDSNVLLKAGDTLFRVSSQRLCAVSPPFQRYHKKYKPLVQNTRNTPVRTLPFTAEVLRDFVWYLYVSHIDFEDYTAKCPHEERFRRSINIARIAHFYEATTIRDWAMSQIITLLPSSDMTDISMIIDLQTVAEQLSSFKPELITVARDHWRSVCHKSLDPVAWLLAAKNISDKNLQAYAYFHTLSRTNDEIRADDRLTALDRLRLSIGALNLQRHVKDPCSCVDLGFSGHQPSCHSLAIRRDIGATSSGACSPQVVVPLKDSYGGESLWSMFTRSPMGFELEDGIVLLKL